MSDVQAVLARCKWLFDEVVMMLAVSFWVGQIIGQTIGTIVALCCLPNLLAASFLTFQVVKGQPAYKWALTTLLSLTACVVCSDFECPLASWKGSMDNGEVHACIIMTQS